DIRSRGQKAPEILYQSLMHTLALVPNTIEPLIPFNRSKAEEKNSIRIEKSRNKTVADLRRQQEQDPPDPGKFVEIVVWIESLVQRIQSRGGRVIFISPPMSGEVWEVNKQVFPRKDFWDVFSVRTSAKTIHFKDYPSLANFVCPDGLHLD